jgi:hypothetical protein
MMKKLDVDLGELEIALDNSFYEHIWYLDRETGELTLIQRNYIEGDLDDVYDVIYDEEGERVQDLASYLEDSDFRDWAVEQMLIADRIRQDTEGRYIAVDRQDSREGYRDMELFIRRVEDEGLQDRLWRAIQGRGAFRMFKDVLLDYPDVRERWFAFRDARHRARARDWLERHGIELRKKRDTESTE